MRKVTSGCRIPQLAGERGGAPPHRCFYATPPTDLPPPPQAIPPTPLLITTVTKY